VGKKSHSYLRDSFHTSRKKTFNLRLIVKKGHDPIPVDYGMYIHWVIVTGCNFSCPYCLVSEHARKSPVKAVDIDRVIKRLDQTGEKILITFTGGEPLLIPNFAELIIEVTKKHLVRIDTNLSIKRNYEKILNEVDPAQVWEINYSAHVEEREARKMHLEELCETVARFKDRGFRMNGNYVAYPPMMNRMEKDLEYFLKRGISVTPTFYWGYYNEKFFPFHQGEMQYSTGELELIMGKNLQTSKVLDESYGGICMAGSKAFLVNLLNVFPCGGSRKKLGNFFDDWETIDKALTCCIDFCHGPFNRAFDRNDPRTSLSYLAAKTALEIGHYDMRKSMKYFLGKGETPPSRKGPIYRSSRHIRPVLEANLPQPLAKKNVLDRFATTVKKRTLRLEGHPWGKAFFFPFHLLWRTARHTCNRLFS